jgi:hypothetical protein
MGQVSGVVARAYKDGLYYGAEVEALGQEVLQQRVLAHIKLYTDDATWMVSESQEDADLKKLSEIK